MKQCLPESGVQHSTYLLPALLFLSIGCLPAYIAGQNDDNPLSYEILKKMSLRQLAGQWAISAGGFNNVLADSAKSDLRIQAYYDQTWRDLLNSFAANLRTADIDCFNGMLTCRF